MTRAAPAPNTKPAHDNARPSKSHGTRQTRPLHQNGGISPLSGDCGASNARDVLAATMTEKDLMEAVEQTAQLCGWTVYHPYDSRRSTPGYPDLTCCHPERGVIWIETKTAKGRLRPEQREWLERLRAAGANVAVWRPRDWLDGTVATVLCGEDIC